MSAHEELLALHTLLMCPAECPPIQDGDTQTVRLLKGLIDNWHALVTAEEALRAALERIAKYPRVRGDELGYDGCRQVARDALKTANVEFRPLDADSSRPVAPGTEG